MGGTDIETVHKTVQGSVWGTNMYGLRETTTGRV